MLQQGQQTINEAPGHYGIRTEKNDPHLHGKSASLDVLKVLLQSVKQNVKIDLK
jgi:hypothetical protein